MPTSPYFSNFPGQNRLINEHRLMEDVIVESIQIMGHNVYYIPREELDNMDMIFGETTKVRFKRAYLIESYIANVEGFEGDSDFFSKFGLEIRDSSNFVVSRRSFAKIVPTALRERPREGDLIYVPLMHRMFEIKFIEKKLMFFSLGNRHPFIYEMRCEDFRYSEEFIDTGIEEIDDVEKDNAFTVKLSLNINQGSGEFGFDDVIYQSPDGTWNNNTAHAEMKEWYEANGTMFVFGTSGQFVAGQNVYSNTTGAVYRVISVDDKSDYVTFDEMDNQLLGTDTTLILDLSELNPFGSP